jgi:hypothetical protein
MTDYQGLFRQPESNAAGGRLVPWSIQRAIELLDEAIDRMGTQLARASASSMDWRTEEPGKSHRAPADDSRSFPAVRPASCLDVEVQTSQAAIGPELP